MREYLNHRLTGERPNFEDADSHPQIDRIYKKMALLCLEVVGRTDKAKDFSAAIAQIFSQKSDYYDWLCPTVYNALGRPLENLIANCKTIISKKKEEDALAQEISEFVYDNLYILLAIEETEWVLRNNEDAITRIQDIAEELGPKTTITAIMARRRGDLEKIMERIEKGERISRPHSSELYVCIPYNFTVKYVDKEALTRALNAALSIDNLRAMVKTSDTLEEDLQFLDMEKALVKVRQLTENKIGWIKRDTTNGHFTDGHIDPFIRACNASNIASTEVEGKTGVEIINDVLIPIAMQEIIRNIVSRYNLQKDPNPKKWVKNLKWEGPCVWGEYDTGHKES